MATFIVGMKGGDVVECDLLAGMDVAKGHEEDVVVSDSHVAASLPQKFNFDTVLTLICSSYSMSWPRCFCSRR